MSKIKKEDFIAIVGFYGHTAVVDKRTRKEVFKKKASQLLEKGLYKEAVALAVYDAVYDKDETAQREVLNFFNNQQPVEGFDFLKREFGVDEKLLEKNIKIIKI